MNNERPVKSRKMTIKEFMREFPGQTIPASLTASGCLDEEEWDEPLFNMQIMKNGKEKG